jgi:hypothetical protein
MSKNLFSRSLAVVASSALAVTGLVGISSPAYAAGEIKIAPAAGTEWIIPSTNFFAVKANYQSGYSAANAAKLKLKITTNGGFQVDTDTDVDSLANATDAITNSTVGVGTLSASKTIGQDLGIVGLDINGASDATTYSVVVQAYEDSDGDNAIDTGEWSSTAETITFIKNSDVTWTIAVDPKAPGIASTATATVTSNANIGLMAWGDGTDATTNGTNGAVRFEDDTVAAGTFAQTGSAVAPVRVTYNEDDNQLEAESATSDAAWVAGDKVRAKFYFVNAKDLIGVLTDGGITDDIAGTGTYAIPVGGLDPEATATVTVSTPTVASISDVLAPRTTSTVVDGSDVLVKSGTTSLSAYLDVLTVTAGSVKSGIPVTFTIAEQGVNTLESTASVVAGGKTLKNTNAGTVQSIEVVVNTDSDGRATVPMTASGVDDADALNITASVQGFEDDSDFTWTIQTVKEVRQLNGIDGQSVDAALSFPKDAAFTLNFGVVDQWDSPITAAGYSVRVSTGAQVLSAPVVNGQASLVWPAFTSNGTNVFLAEGLKNGVDTATGDDNFTVLIQPDDVPLALTYAGTYPAAGSAFGVGVGVDVTRNAEVFVAADTRIGQFAEDYTTSGVVVSGTVTKTGGAAAATTVTLSGTDLEFVSGDVYAKGTITVRTSVNGEFDVLVMSNATSTRTLTMTSGTVVKTQDIVFAAADETDGEVLALTAPTSVKAGSTLVVGVKLTDNFGNPVNGGQTAATSVAIDYDGPGFVVSDLEGLDSLGTDGAYSVRILLGASDYGIATVTFSYDNGDTETTVSKSVWVGPIANAKAGVKDGRVLVYAYRAIGRTVRIYVGGTLRASFVPDINNDRYILKGITSGNRNVSVRISGDGEDFRGTITVK